MYLLHKGQYQILLTSYIKQYFNSLKDDDEEKQHVLSPIIIVEKDHLSIELCLIVK